MGDSDARSQRLRRLERAIDAGGFEPGEPFACPYRPGFEARHQTLVPSPLVPGVYQALMDLNFRRLGPVFYRPACAGCRSCRMLRVVVDEFQPSRSQRRCWSRNHDVTVEAGRPIPSPEKHALYRRYLAARHDGQMSGSLAEFSGFLYTSGVDTIEVRYRQGERILGVGIADVEPLALSAVYSYFEPSEAGRSLGVLNVLWLVEECRRRALPHLYLGYFVSECSKMSYKAGYRPCELLDPEAGVWRRA